MAAHGHKHKDKKQSRSQRRRDTENAVFEELAELLPLSQDVKQDKLSVLRLTVAYLKLRAGLQTDEQDLEECLEANTTTGFPSQSPSPPPLAMLDSDGNLIAGSLDPSPKVPARAVLPERVVSELEKTFLSECKNSDNTDINLLKEKFQKYKEGLETGMQEFLNQDPSDIVFENNSSNDLAPGGSNIICHKSSNPVRNTTTKQGTAMYSIGKENRVCRTYTEHKKSTLSCVSTDDPDNSLALIHSVPEGSMSLEAARGFILSLDKEKRVLFVTENVSQFLGLCQWSVIGQDVSEFVYEKDYPELERQMSDAQFNTGDGSESLQPWQVRRTFYVAMKFCFQKPGSRLKDCGFQLYQWNAKLRLCKDPATGKAQVKGLVSLCCPLQRDTMMSSMDSANFFMIRYSFKDSRILFCDPKIEDLLGYSPSELIGIKHSDLKHPADIVMCRFNYRNLPADGKVESGYYRLLSRVGVWVWMYSNFNMLYNKAGEPEILIMKNIIVSQAEAECVLSREKRDFQRIQIHGTSDIFSEGMPVSSIAALKFLRARRKRKPFLDSVYTVSVSGESGSVKPKSAELPSEKTPSVKLERKCVNKLTELRNALRKQATSNKETLHREIEQCSTQDQNVDTHQGTGSDTSLSSKQQVFTTADSDRATEMLFFDKLAQDIPAAMSPSWRDHTNSAAQEWSLDSLLFKDSEDDIISSTSSNSEAPIGCSFSLEKLTGASGEANADLLSSNDQMIQLQTKSTGQYDTEVSPVDQPRISGNPCMPTQAYSSLAVSDDHCLDNIIDFLDDDSSSDDAVFLMASSGNVMLSSITAPQPIRSFITAYQPNRTSITAPQPIRSSFAAIQPITPSITVHRPIGVSVTASQPIGSSVTAPQPIRSKQEKERFLHSLNRPDFQTSQTNYNNTDWLLDKQLKDAPNVISQETVHSSIRSDCPEPTGVIHVDNFGLYSSLCHASPAVSCESDIYSPGKLDYPPFEATLKANQVSGHFAEHYNKNHSDLTKQAVATKTSSKQSIHKVGDTPEKGISFNTCPESSMLGFPEASMHTIQNRFDHQTQQIPEKVSSNSQVIEHTLSNFSEAVSHTVLLSEDICCYLINTSISTTTTTDNTTNNENSLGVTVLQDLTDFASKMPEDLLHLTDSVTKLPEDLLDVELDCDWLNS